MKSTTLPQYGFFDTLRHIWAGQSIMRISMNRAFARETLSGRTVDVGGGHHPDYFDYFQKTKDATLEALDASLSGIDFEKDMLPYQDHSIDTIVCANVLEHIYNYRFLVSEMRRVLREGGQIIGFVPFSIQYHPDPHDYFRYTREALLRILTDAGFAHVSIDSVGGGPFLVNFNTIMLSISHILRILLYPWYAIGDYFFLKFRSQARERYPLGYIFTAH